MKIFITGASGFIGKKLVERLLDDGHSITTFDRHPIERPNVTAVYGDLAHGKLDPELLSGQDVVIHLAGAPVSKRWTSAYKQEMYDSRVIGAVWLRDGIKSLPVEQRPIVFISASGIGYFGDGGEIELHEDSPAGTDFLARLCVDWEAEALGLEEAGLRCVVMRTGIVLGQGGIVKTLAPLFRRGLGNVLANGRQWFSWIHVDDLVALYRQSVTDATFKGIYCAVAPEPVRYQDFAEALGQAVNKPVRFKIPRFLMTIFMGDQAAALTASQRVKPERLLERNFNYQHPELNAAIRASLQD